MRDYIVLREEIMRLGASLIEEHLHPESFGSAYAVLQGIGGQRFRLIWDGKEGYGFLESSGPGDTWHDLPQRVYGTSSIQSRQVAELLSAAKVLINGSVAV